MLTTFADNISGSAKRKIQLLKEEASKLTTDVKTYR